LEVLVLPVLQKRLRIAGLEGDRASAVARAISEEIDDDAKAKLRSCLEGAIADPLDLDEELGELHGVIVDVAMNCLPALLELLVLPVAQERLEPSGVPNEATAAIISKFIGRGEKSLLKQHLELALSDPVKGVEELMDVACALARKHAQVTILPDSEAAKRKRASALEAAIANTNASAAGVC
jgi:hypothetical protein